VRVVPPRVAAVIVSKLVPVTVTDVPPVTTPEVTEREEIVDGGRYVNAPAEVTVWPYVERTTSFAPRVPAGIVIVRDVVVFAVIKAGVPPIVTVWTVIKLVPEIPLLTPPRVFPVFALTVVIVGAGQSEILVTLVGLFGSVKPLIYAVFPGLATHVRGCKPKAVLLKEVKVLGSDTHLS
jgi:hypothetical protein